MPESYQGRSRKAKGDDFRMDLEWRILDSATITDIESAPMTERPTLQNVYEARRRIAPYVVRTPLHRYLSLDELLRAEIYVKHENHQRLGAFKVRGGVNLLSQMSDEEKSRGVITASTGNHGQSIAYAARAFGVAATIVAPEGSNPDKVAAMRALGAEVPLVGADFDEAREWCEERARTKGHRYVHSANEPLLIAGVGTYALEILEALPEVEVLIVPVGAGSGICGAGLVAKTINPRIHLVGVQARNAPAVYESYLAREMCSQPSAATFADGLATRVPFEFPMGMIWKFVDEMILVSEEEMCEAIRLLVAETRTIAEGAGAAATAAAMKMDLQGRKVAAVVSGRNLTAENLKIILAGGVPAAH